MQLKVAEIPTEADSGQIRQESSSPFETIEDASLTKPSP
jgi:hypothetical protein